MKKQIVILAHDPGGYDVTYPVYRCLQDNNQSVRFFCIGPAAQIQPDFLLSEPDLLQFLEEGMKQNQISLLITGTSWGKNLELECIKRCKSFGVKTISILDYWSNYSKRFFHTIDQELIYPDYCIVMDEFAEQQMVQEGIPQEIIQVLGHPGLDQFVKRRRANHNNGKASKALFLSQPLSSLYGNQYGYTEVEVLNDLIMATNMLNIDFYVKFHPKDHPDYIKQFRGQGVQGELKSILPLYDLVIGMNSMGLLYSTLMGVPAISYQPNLMKEDLCITNIMGLTPLITSFDQLISCFGKSLDQSKTEIDLNELRNKYIWLDGHSSERIYHFIKGVIAGEF